MSGSRKSSIDATGDQGLHHGIRVGVPQADLRAAPRVLAWRGDRQVDPSTSRHSRKKPVSDSDRAHLPDREPVVCRQRASAPAPRASGPSRPRARDGGGGEYSRTVAAGRRPFQPPAACRTQRGAVARRTRTRRAGPAAEVLVAAAHGEVGPVVEADVQHTGRGQVQQARAPTSWAARVSAGRSHSSPVR